MDNFYTAMIAMLVLIVAFISLIWCGVWYFTDTVIVSKTMLQPTIELAINNNQVDTVYVYTQK